MTDITAVFNVHKEGRLLVPGIRSFLAAIDCARRACLTVEAYVIADASDWQTLAVVRATAPDLEIVETVRGDLGLARNAAVSIAKGRYVAFLDADDMWGTTWLRDALLEARNHPSDDFVAHPQWWISFNTTNVQMRLSEHIGSDDLRFNPNRLVQNNPWTALCFAPRTVFVNHPYCEREPGIGFEDWQFNLTTLAHGIKHIAVPDTIHFIRGNAGRQSLSSQNNVEGYVVGSNPFYDARPAFDGQKARPADMAGIDKGWLAARITDASQLDPRCWPLKGPLTPWMVPESSVAAGFWRMQETPGHGNNIVIVTPNCKPSALFMAAIEEAQALHAATDDGRILFITTETDLQRVTHDEAAIIMKLFEVGDFMSWRDYGAGLSIPEQIFLLQKFIVQNQPEKLICVDDPLMAGVLRANSRAIRLYTDVTYFAAEPKTIGGRRISPALEHMPDFFDNLQKVICETRRLHDELCTTYGFPPAIAGYLQQEKENG